MGIKLMTNFNRPYHSSSINEFWKRWHISLSTWFRDYLYISLGGNRVTIPRWYFNLFIVFLVSGLWHGANWTFIVWGALHGFYLVFSLVTRNVREKFNELFHLKRFSLLPILATFGLVSFAWIFFRAPNVHTAVYIAKHMVTGLPEAFHMLVDHRYHVLNLGISRQEMMLSVLLIIFLETVHYTQRKVNLSQKFRQKPAYVRWAVYSCFILAILALGVFEDRQFIYFQF